MIGKTLGHYQIISRLGKGGMGQVYRARDTRVACVVAIKKVKEQHSDRFKQEVTLIFRAGQGGRGISERGLISPSAASGRNPICTMDGGRALSVVSFQLLSSKHKRKSA